MPLKLRLIFSLWLICIILISSPVWIPYDNNHNTAPESYHNLNDPEQITDDEAGSTLIEVVSDSENKNKRAGSECRAEELYEQASDGLPTASPSGGDSGWTGIDFGDFNGDGYDDLVAVGRKGNGPEPYISDGKGKWSYSRTGITSSWSGRSDVRVVDINKDDKLDIVSSDSGIWLGDGTGKWTEATDTPFHGEDIDVGDYDNDGDLDVVIMGHLSGGIQAFKNDGFGDWISTNASIGLPTANMGGHKIRFGDVNNDNNLDINGATDYYEPVWLGDGRGNWSRSVNGITANTQWWGVSVGDIDHDNNLDLAMSVFHSHTVSGGIYVYKGDGTGSWSNASMGLPTTGEYGDLELADMNNDGHLDIVAGICGFGSVIGELNIWYGDGNGSWTKADIGLPTDTEEVEGLDVGDLDNDGYMDIGISYYGEDGVQVLRALTPKPVFVNVTSPNGGEKIRIGTDYIIKWHAVGGDSPLRVKLEYSITGADGSYKLIADDLVNNGEYTWQVPLYESTNCYIKVSANDSSPYHSMGFDKSNNSFELYKLPIKKVIITPDAPVVIKNDKKLVEAQAFDIQDNLITGGVYYYWQLTGAVGTINPNDDTNYTVFEASFIGEGTLKVTAEYFGTEVEAEIKVTVPQTLANLELSSAELYMIETNSYSVSVNVYDIDGALIQDPLLVYSWKFVGIKAKFTSATDTDTVNIHAMETGIDEIDIMVSYYNMSINLRNEFEVFPKVLKFAVTPTNPVVKLGETKNFTTTAMGLSSSDLIEYATVTWKIDEGPGRVEYSEPGTDAKFIPETSGWVTLNATLNYLDDKFINLTRIFVPYELNRISVEPDDVFVYYGTSKVFTVTAYDKIGFRIHDEMNLRVDQSRYIGDIDESDDGHSFEITANAKGTATVTVTANYYGYTASKEVEVTVPPALELINIESSETDMFVRQSITLTAVVHDIDGDRITSGLIYNWSIPASFSNIQANGDYLKVVPVAAGNYFVNLTINYYGRTFTESKEITINQIIERVEIELPKGQFVVSKKSTLTARAFDTEGNEFLDGVEYNWDATGGSLSNFEGKTVIFQSDVSGAFTITVDAKLKQHRKITDSENVIIQVQPEEQSAGFVKSNGTALAAIAIVAIVIIIIFLFLMLRKKKAEERGEQELGEVQIPEISSVPQPQQYPSMDVSGKLLNYEEPAQYIYGYDQNMQKQPQQSFQPQPQQPFQPGQQMDYQQELQFKAPDQLQPQNKKVPSDEE